MKLRKDIKISATPVLLISILILSLISGCTGESATTEPVITAQETTAEPGTTTSESLQIHQLFADMITAIKNIKTYKFTMDMTSLIEATGGEEARNINMAMNAKGFYDQLNKNMYMTMEINLDMDVPELEEDTQHILMDMYILEEYIYMKMDMPLIGEQWMKMPVTDEIRDDYNTNIVNEQLELLESSTDIEFLRYETVDGVNCYVLKLIPDFEKLLGWALEQQMADTGLNADDTKNIADVFKDISYVVWITREDKLPRKFDINMSMNFTAEQFGEDAGDMDSMNMTTDMVMDMFDYNVPETIILPEEAEDAIEMPQLEKSGNEL